MKTSPGELLFQIWVGLFTQPKMKTSREQNGLKNLGWKVDQPH